MHVLHGAHHEGPQIHFHRRDWQICDTDAVRLHTGQHPVVAAPLSPGGCLFFAGLLPHGTPHNSSDNRRRALQYHYRPADTPEISQEDLGAVFGSEGKGVQC
jgi:phytanoyl-CoA hydroxylase